MPVILSEAKGLNPLPLYKARCFVEPALSPQGFFAEFIMRLFASPRGIRRGANRLRMTGVEPALSKAKGLSMTDSNFFTQLLKER